MKAKFLRLLILSSFLVTGCSAEDMMFWKKKESEPEQQQKEEEQIGGEQGGEQTPADPDPYYKKTVDVKMEALLKGGNDLYTLKFDYNDRLFLNDAEEYDKDLSLLSFGAAISGTYKNWVEDFLDDCDFENITTHDMDIEPTSETLGYALAHKSIDDSELFSVIIRGHEYKREWSNNFIIGETGDHEGWLARTDELYTALSSYINQHKGEKTLKLWVVGYSRAGAISNMLASYIFRNDGFGINAKNMFVYTFEAPAGLTGEHAIKYNNVHNIVNSADIVAHIPPTQYELYRCGNDFEIYNSNFGVYVANFDNEISIPAFVPCDSSDFGGQTITNDAELTEYLINDIFSQKVSSDATAHNRESYVANYQSGLSYSIGLLFALSGTSRSAILADPMNLGIVIMFDTDGSGLADYLKPYLDSDHVDYDYDELVLACAVFEKAFTNLFGTILNLYMGQTYSNNLTRILDMHYPEVTYCLLKNANSKL